MTFIITTKRMDKRYEYLPCYRVFAKGLVSYFHSHSRSAVVRELQALNQIPTKHYHFDDNNVMIDGVCYASIQKTEKGILKRRGKIKVKYNTDIKG
jgi:hypothetical protein